MKWEMVRLSSFVLELTSGGRPKGGAIDSGIPSIGAEHIDGFGGFQIKNLKCIPEDYFNKMSKGKIQTGDILIVKDGATTGKVSIVSDSFPFPKAAINEHVFNLRLDTIRLLPKYCFYHLFSSTGKKQILDDFRGATVGGISKEFVNKIWLPVPSFSIQQKIAAILDQADILRRKDKELLKKYDDLLQSVFYSMFGDPVKNDKGWGVKKLYELVQANDKINYGVVQPGDDDVNGVPIVRIGDFKEMFVDKSNLKRISPDIERKYKKSRLIGDEILVACVGATIGKIAFADKSLAGFNLVRATARIRLDNLKVNRWFVGFLLSTPIIQEYFIKETRTVSQPTLNISHIENAPIIHPPIELQNVYANIALGINEQRRICSEQADRSEALFQSLLQRAFKGELVE